MHGMNIDTEVLAQTQANILAENAVRMAQLEAAVQQLANEKQELQFYIDSHIPGDEEVVEDASAGS